MTNEGERRLADYRQWLAEAETELLLAEANLRVTRSGVDAAAVLRYREIRDRMREVLASVEAARCAEVRRSA